MFAGSDYRWRRRLVVIIAVSLFLLFSAVYFIIGRVISFYSTDEARLYELSQSYAGDPVASFGLNLEKVESANILKNGGFEPDVLQFSYLALEGSEDSFAISSISIHDQDKNTSDFYEDAVIRIYNQTQERLSLRHEAEIKDYLAGQVQASRQILLPAELPEDIALRAVSEHDGKIMLVGEGGTVLELSREGESKLHNTGDGAGLISISGGPTGWLALADDGSYYLSADARDWKRAKLSDSKLNQALAVFKEGRYFFLAIGDQGSLYKINHAGAEKIELEIENDLYDLLLWEDQIIVCGSDGLIMKAGFDYQFEAVEDLSLMTDWLSIDANHEGIVCCGTLGSMAYSSDGINFSEIDPMVMAKVHGVDPSDDLSASEDIVWPNLVNCARVTDEAVLFQTATGESWLSSRQGAQLEKSPYFSAQGIRLIESLSSGRLLALYDDGSINLASLADIISFEPALENGTVQPGDLVFFEKQNFTTSLDGQLIAEENELLEQAKEVDLLSKQDAVPGRWHLSQGAALQHLSNGKGRDFDRGDGCIKISYSGEATENKDLLISSAGELVSSVYNKMPAWLNARIAQRLDLPAAGKLTDSFYRLELYLKQEGLASNSVYLWLSGLKTEVSGHIVEKLGSEWEKHQFIFVLGQNNAGSEVWLNIGFSGEGSLWLDQIWFGSTQDEATELPVSLREEILEQKPAVIRLAFAPLGTAGFGNHSWLLPEGSGSRLPLFSAAKTSAEKNTQENEATELHNLGAALKLSEQVNADPWLVIDAMATDAELYHLIEYLAGPAASDYGKLRLAQGAVGRWTDQLSRFYLEIQDSGQVFDNDASRMTYVNHVIDTIQSAPDYPQLEKKLVIVDGMAYDGNVLASKADYHAGVLIAEDKLSNYGDMRSLLAEFLRSMPTRRILGGSNAPEMIKSFSWQDKAEGIRLADYAALVFAEAGRGINLVLADFDDPVLTANFNKALFFAGNEISGQWALAPAEEKFTLDQDQDEESFTAEAEVADSGLDPEEEELIILSYTDENLRTIILINLGNKNMSLRLGGRRPIEQGEIYSYDARASLLARDKIKSSRHIFRVLPGGMAVLIEEETDKDK